MTFSFTRFLQAAEKNYIPFSVITLLCFLLNAGCEKSTQDYLPLIPVEYYRCIEATPEDLEKAYFSNYGNRWLSQTLYDNQIFVFKNVIFTPEMSQQLTEQGYIWLGIVKCVPTDLNSVGKIKPDKCIDIVGINTGVPTEIGYGWSLLMTGCYFLPAGAMALPAVGGPTFVPGY